jgi:FkbM family methyltransferase
MLVDQKSTEGSNPSFSAKFSPTQSRLFIVMNNLTECIQTSDLRWIILTNDRYITPCLKFYGEYGPEEMDLLGEFIGPESTVLDVGANIGTHTVAFAKKAPRGKVISFEPQRFVYQILCGNIAINGLTNVQSFHCALGRSAGAIDMPILDYSEDQNYGGMDVREHARRQGVVFESTPLIDLDSLGLTKVSVIKIDVETMEEEVLRGGFKTIFQCQPIIYVEADRHEYRIGLATFLQTLGYELWLHRPPMISLKTQRMFESRNASLELTTQEKLKFLNSCIAVNLLCLPKGFEQLNPEFIQKYNLRKPAGL